MAALNQHFFSKGTQLMPVEPSLSLKACFIAFDWSAITLCTAFAVAFAITLCTGLFFAFDWSACALALALALALCTWPTCLDHWANGRWWMSHDAIGYLLDKPRVNPRDK